MLLFLVIDENFVSCPKKIIMLLFPLNINVLESCRIYTNLFNSGLYSFPRKLHNLEVDGFISL